jgi:nucleoside-diphosphate-sugar epimerase
MRILVTGSTGFIGKSLVARLKMDLFSIAATTRDSSFKEFGEDIHLINMGNMTPSLDWSHALGGVDVVVHLAARTHVLREHSINSLADYRYINVDCSLNLARQAAQAGVKRFIYLSSIKVNGESTILGKPYTAADDPRPEDFYGESKHEAELGLRGIAEESGMEYVIIRPPLVYGPGVKANFLAMMNWLWHCIPLPLGEITKNKRSFVYVDNLVDVIVSCIKHPRAASEIFLVSDDEDMSTTDLLSRVANQLGKSVKLIAVPEILIIIASKLICREGATRRLCASLQVDIAKTKKILDWSPPVRVDDGLRLTVEHFLNTKK